MKALLLALVALCLAAGTALAQPWPNRPIHLVVAYPPGGVSDEISRALADKLSAQLGTPVLVEHRAGAGGALAMEMLAKAPPDGYTLVFSAISPLVLTPHLGRVGYEPLKDIAPVVGVMFTPVLLVGTPALKANSFAEMLEAAQTRPGGLRWATSGLATTGHMVLEQVKLISGASITHIPYKGGGQQLNDALGGQFELLSSNVGAQQLRHIRSGRFKALAVGAPNRLDVLPDVPTLAELGFAPANLVSLFGIFAPGKTPEPVLARLNAELNRALQLPDIRQRLLTVNNLPAGGSAADFARHIAREWELNRRLVENAGGQLK